MNGHTSTFYTLYTEARNGHTSIFYTLYTEARNGHTGIFFKLYFTYYQSICFSTLLIIRAVVVVIVWKLDSQLHVPITSKVVCSNPVHDEVYSIQHYVIKFVSDLRQFGGFLRELRFPPSIKLTATIKLKYYLKWRLNTIFNLLK
jgi:hypothetical protein